MRRSYRGQHRVLLIQAPAPRQNTNPPLGLAYLGAALEEVGCEVRIIDATAPYADYTIEDLLREAREFRPHLIGFTTFITYIAKTYQAMEAFARANLGVPIVAGGPHATILPGEVLEHGADVVVIGEGERTIQDLVDFVRGGKRLEDIPGLACRKDGAVVFTPPRPLIQSLDDLPLPARHLFRTVDYMRHPAERERFGHLFTSRGCPFGCTYCSNLIFGRQFRFHSPERVLAEIENLVETYGVSRIRFIDDSFTVDKARVARICDLLLESKLDLSWVCETRLDRVDRELLAKMKLAGCRTATYGIESGHPETLKRIRKGFSREEALAAAKLTAAAGINCSANFMWGFPWESASDIRVSADFLKELSPFVSVFAPTGILVPMPGTPIYEECRDEYGLEGWWLRGFEAASGERLKPPLYEMIYYNFMVLERDFFRYPKEVVAEMKRAGEFIGRHNMRTAARRVSQDLHLPEWITYPAVVGLCKASQWLYRISPRLERFLMRPFLYAASKYQHLN